MGKTCDYKRYTLAEMVLGQAGRLMTEPVVTERFSADDVTRVKEVLAPHDEPLPDEQVREMMRNLGARTQTELARALAKAG